MLCKIEFKIIAISRKHMLGKYKPHPCDGISYKLSLNWTSKQNVSSAALQIKTSEITVHLWSHYFLHFETAIVSREMKRKWVYSPHMSLDIPWEFRCIQFSYYCSKGILT